MKGLLAMMGDIVVIKGCLQDCVNIGRRPPFSDSVTRAPNRNIARRASKQGKKLLQSFDLLRGGFCTPRGRNFFPKRVALRRGVSLPWPCCIKEQIEGLGRIDLLFFSFLPFSSSSSFLLLDSVPSSFFPARFLLRHSRRLCKHSPAFPSPCLFSEDFHFAPFKASSPRCVLVMAVLLP